jgi:hypothetical protein
VSSISALLRQAPPVEAVAASYANNNGTQANRPSGKSRANQDAAGASGVASFSRARNAAREERPLDLLQACSAHLACELLRCRPREHRARQVLVSFFVLRHHPADERQQAREVEAIQAAQERSGGHAELEHNHAPARPRDAHQLAQSPHAIGHIADAKGNRGHIATGCRRGQLHRIATRKPRI